MALFRTLFIWSFVAIPALVDAAELSSYRADIRAVRHGTIDIKAKGEVRFDIKDDEQWSLSFDLKGGPFKTSEKTVGSHFNGNHVPLSFKRETKVLFVKENASWDFDWDNQKITGKRKDKNYEFELDETIHDPNSFQLPLRKGLMNGETQFNFQFMRTSRPGQLKFEVVGEELIELKSGRVHTLILKQTKPLRTDEKKLIWVAKNYDFIPVRFTTFNKDKVRDDMIVERLWINNEPINFATP